MKSNKKTSLFLSNKLALAIIGAVLLLIIASVVTGFIAQPERSLASFCRVAKQEKLFLIGDVNYEQRLTGTSSINFD